MSGYSKDQVERAKKIKLVILDVDGVLTDGRISLTSEGQEIKTFDVKDGLGVVLLQEAGIECILVSAMASRVIQRRAEQLGIREVYSGVSDKNAVFQMIKRSRHLKDEQICAMGDDLLDLPILRQVGLAACPCDSAQDVQETAHVVTSQGGGRGAVRELAEMILKAQGVWEGLVKGIG